MTTLTKLALGLAVLGGLAALNRRAARRATPPSLPIERFLTVDGVRVHYIEQGSGPAVVLLHGNGAMAEDFRISGVLDLLALRYRVIAFDRPGFGYTARPVSRIWSFDAQASLLRQALEQLGVARAIIVGHSAGTQAALAMALQDPSACTGLVLLSGFYFPRLRGDVVTTSVLALPGLRQVTALVTAHLVGWLVLPAYLRRVFAPNRISPAFNHRFPAAVPLRPSQLGATMGDTPLMVLSAARLRRRYAELRMPTAILAGNEDRIVATRRQSDRLHACLPGSSRQEIAGAGHMIHHVDPQLVAAAIDAVADRAAAECHTASMAPTR